MNESKHAFIGARQEYQRDIIKQIYTPYNEKMHLCTNGLNDNIEL